MKILGIETSCDETAAAVVEDGRHILSNVVVSQIDIFAAYGGVIPEVAARSHLEAIQPVINRALLDAHCSWDDIDAIAVTHAPGLLGSLLIGTLAARTLAILHNKPLYPVHHLKSHIYSNWLKEEVGAKTTFVPSFPLLALVISGGHTQILYMRRHNHFEIIGSTRDDAVGECFDKVAKILGLPYPGGPSISKAATAGDPYKYPFPHPKLDGLDFSFSGLKTAVLRTCQELVGGNFKTPSTELKNLLTDQQKSDIAASFEHSATDILIEKLQKALELHPDVESVVIAGGVSANQNLRHKLRNCYAHSNFYNHKTKRYDFQHSHYLSPRLLVPVYFPDPKLSGDNGAMVASAAFYEISSGVQAADPYKINILPRTDIA